jgi:hypothetical protein
MTIIIMFLLVALATVALAVQPGMVTMTPTQLWECVAAHCGAAANATTLTAAQLDVAIAAGHSSECYAVPSVVTGADIVSYCDVTHDGLLGRDDLANPAYLMCNTTAINYAVERFCQCMQQQKK